MESHAITLLSLFAAAVIYAVGFGFGVELAVAMGFISEMIFWVRVSRGLAAGKAGKTVANN